MKTINQLRDEIKEKAREYSGCEDVPNCSNCSWMPDDDMQNSCSNRLEYKAFIEGANYILEKLKWKDPKEELPKTFNEDGSYNQVITKKEERAEVCEIDGCDLRPYGDLKVCKHHFLEPIDKQT